MKKLLVYFVMIVAVAGIVSAQAVRSSKVLDDGSSSSVWTAFHSIGVESACAEENGAVRLDVRFPKGSGYGGIVRNFNEALPENYEITFRMRATVPVNNFEVKVSGDSSGECIWWVNNKGYTYPTEWKTVVVKKRHLGYAWGTKFAPFPPKLARLEFVVTAGTGGAGSVWIDDVTLTTLPMVPAVVPVPEVKASSFVKKNGAPTNVLEGKSGAWISKGSGEEWIELDLKYEKEFGAVQCDWDTSLGAVNYEVQGSYDGKNYTTLYTVKDGAVGSVLHYTPESDARFVRLMLKGNSAKRPYMLKEFSVIPSEKLSTPNHYFETLAANAPIGSFPRYFLKQQPYWTIVGVPTDTREALFGEDGAFETDRQKFSLEPFVVQSGKVVSWNDGVTVQSLDDRYLPIPTVERRTNDLLVRTTLVASGEPERSAVLAQYVVKNLSSAKSTGSFFIALRPFQVNPTSQWLNYDGGFAKTQKIAIAGAHAVVDGKDVYVAPAPAKSGAASIDQGDISSFFAKNTVPASASAENANGMTSGLFQYPYTLAPGESLIVVAAVPFTPAGNRWVDAPLTVSEFASVRASVADFWRKRLNTVEFTVNSEAQHLVDIQRSYLAYILINMDRNGFQPGSRSYERSWIRDGSMTSDALLKLGITEEPKKYLDWYSSYQYESGAVPCVVDTRGPDPVPEHDSHGELIFACMEYFRFTGDTAFLRARWNTVVGAVNYIQSLRAQRMTPEYKNGDDEKRAFYGLVTESISHEGYSDKPMHSYWDNFFVLKGFKDAAAIAAVLGKKEAAKEYDSIALAFRHDLYSSIALAMKNRKVDYIPGCVEKGDFDATSTSIALFPNGEMSFVPQPAYNRTFDKYFDWFISREEGKIDWTAYTPYEVRTIGTYVYLGQKERAHHLLDYFLKDQRPQGWNHWAEVVANGYRTVRFIGDMPHTWVGSDYINAFRAMFVYENDDVHSLVVGAGLKDAWVKEGLSVKKLPTHYGTLSYTIEPQKQGVVRMLLSGTIDAAASHILIPVSMLSTPLKSAVVNGTVQQAKNGYITVTTLPATVDLTY